MNFLFGRQAGRMIISSSFLVILVITLFPFNFHSRGSSAKPFLATGIEDDGALWETCACSFPLVSAWRFG
jgi:hypothetical protein